MKYITCIMKSNKEIQDIRSFDNYREALIDYFERLAHRIENTTILPNDLKLIWAKDETLTEIVQVESYSIKIER